MVRENHCSDMESQYSVGVSNRFSLFYEDDDNPGDVVVAPKDKKDKLVKEEKKTTTAPPKTKDNIKEKPLQDTSQSSNKRQTPQETGTKGERDAYSHATRDTISRYRLYR